MRVSEVISRFAQIFPRHVNQAAHWKPAAWAFCAAALITGQPARATVVLMETSLGGINIELYDTAAPQTVANFLNYINNGEYNGTIIHRSVPDFIFQGGRYAKVDILGTNYLFDFPKGSPVPNEFSPSRSNIRGTIAMAKLPGDPDSATSEWFFNLVDNSANLDNQNGGFTVFGHVHDPGMYTVDAIGNLDILPSYHQVLSEGTRYFGELPVLDGDYVMIHQACVNQDEDGACPLTEDLAPNGDGNSDGTPDRDQPHVTTISSPLGGTVTFAAGTALTLSKVDSVITSIVLTQLRDFIPPAGGTASFNNGMYRLVITGSLGAGSHEIQFFDNGSSRPTHYYAYGPTSDNPSPHWYNFSFDGRTGAEITGDRIILHFVDGERGDDDLAANNSVTHSGAQAVVTSLEGSSQGGGCSITGTPRGASHGGDWIAVALFLTAVAFMRKRRQSLRSRVAAKR